MSVIATEKLLLGYGCCMISAVLFISPMPTFYRIISNRSVEHFRADPYIAALLNCAFLIMYGTVYADNKLLIFVNSVGLVFQIIYLVVFFCYADENTQKKVAYWSCAAVASFIAYTLLFLHAVHDPKKRRLAFGVICAVCNIAMYGFPLAILKRVIETASVEFMPFCLAVGLFFNSGVWLAYGLIDFDIYRVVGNAFGVPLGLLQIHIYCHYMARDPSVMPGAVPSLMRIFGNPCLLSMLGVSLPEPELELGSVN